MEFDLQRPCSTKSRAPNRYTKEELKKIAESLGVSQTIVSRGSIDALCASIRRTHTISHRDDSCGHVPREYFSSLRA